jgi:D-threo-aldose 1-dehydrogenase
VNPLEKVAIGDTGVSVSRLGLGGAPLSGMVLGGGLYGGTARDAAVSIISRAHELEISYFDTAPLYGNGRSEARYGGILSELPRESFVLSSKCGRLLVPEDGPDDEYAQDGLPRLGVEFDLSRDGIRRSVEESLERLNLDRFEILYLHDPDSAPGDGKTEAIDFALPAMVELREEGIVDAIGCGMNIWEWPAEFIRASDLDIILLAGRFTLLDHDAYDEFLPLCVERGVKLAIGGPYNSGILARDLDGPVTFNYERAGKKWLVRARALKAVCDRHSVDLRAAALQYPMGHPAVASVIPGAQSAAEVEQNLALASADIPPDLWAELKHEALIPQDASTPT